MSLIDDYHLLELNSNATEQDAKAAYRRLVRLYHPDKNPTTDTTEHFQRLQDAYQSVLSSMRQGAIVQDWHKYEFSMADNKSSTAHQGNDDIQKEYIKESQRAYDEMRRKTASNERAKEAALRSARNKINEKNARKVYEQAAKSNLNTFSSAQSDDDISKDTHAEPVIDPQVFRSFEQSFQQPQQEATHQADSSSVFKKVFIASTYLVVFALGVYSTLYWQDSQKEQAENLSSKKQIPYIAGLYPQFRNGTNYTFSLTSLFATPDSQASEIASIPPLENVTVTNNSKPNWLAIRYQNQAGWVKESDLGFGSIESANLSQCLGNPGIAPLHGKIINDVEPNGNSRLRLLNKLNSHSMLSFESYDGIAPFTVYLKAGQSFAANYIPRGRYRLVLHTGSLYHGACQQFLFNQTSTIVMDQVDFASTELSLTLAL